MSRGFVVVGKISPWQVKTAPSSAWISAEDRMRAVRRMDMAELRAALAWPGTQKTVRLAIERRLRKLGASVETLPQKAQKEVAL